MPKETYYGKRDLELALIQHEGEERICRHKIDEDKVGPVHEQRRLCMMM